MRSIPYGRQLIKRKDIKSVIDVLRSDFLTTGPKVSEFERVFAQYVGSSHAIALNSGTASLHAAMHAAGIGPGNEVIVPPITFVATANSIVYQGGVPVFSDIEPDTLLLDPKKVESKITPNTKAIIAVDYAGQPCDYDCLRKITDKHNLVLIADACHAIGAEYKSRRVGSIADLNTFSFHPVKHITTGEGGMVTTENADYANRLKIFRNHGITTDHNQRAKANSWFYEMVDIGYNYRITDFQCALGISQLKSLPGFLKQRQYIADYYNRAFALVPEIKPLAVKKDCEHAWHLYVVKIDFNRINISREEFFKNLRKKGININVHYIPVHLHQFYKKTFHTTHGLCPEAEAAYEQIVSLPIFPGMTNKDIKRVVKEVKNSLIT